MIKWLRRNIGVIVSSVGMLLLVVVTFGDMGELFTEKYWRSVGGNITSIGAVTLGLVLIQYSIKQGVSEQALSTGLNQPRTVEKYQEHRDIVAKCRPRIMYTPFFLAVKSDRDTRRRKREFIIDNGFLSEKHMRSVNMNKLANRLRIKKFEEIRTHITVDSIKWSTTDIIYNKYGQIEKLEVYRKKRAKSGLIQSAIMMVATTFIAGGLFLDASDVPFWQKMIKLFTYIATMAITVTFSLIKNYEKGAFGVPNELDVINDIWREFDDWKPPRRVVEAVESDSDLMDLYTGDEVTKEEALIEEAMQETKTALDGGADIQEEQEKGEGL